MQEPVLVLNATYEPINVTAVRARNGASSKGVAQSRGDAQCGSPFRGERS